MSDIFQKNMNAGMSRFLSLFQKILTINHSVIKCAKTQDGGYCYVIPAEESKVLPISNHINPLEATQIALDKMRNRIISGLSPAVIIGLNPGFLLETVFRHFKTRIAMGEPFRQIYVIINSLECLAGWLKTADRTEILLTPEVEFYWYEDVSKIVELCEHDENRSHLFAPVSSLPGTLVEKIINPLACLYLKRQKETELWKKSNSEYYDALTDEKLAEIFQGKAGRKPRLLMPTHASSTVVQYSTRDTCAAFEKMGWDTQMLKMSWDLSDWRMVKTIHDFKPDLLIFINHLRTEDMNFTIYPENMMFVTWIQDTMLHLNNRDAADKWNKIALGVNSKTGQPRRRDLLIGYTDIVKPFGYAEDCMTYLQMILNSEIFHSRELTEEQQEKYGCDVCFASNKGKTTEEVLETELFPYLSIFKISRNTAYEIHDLLWKIYRDGKTITSYARLEKLICGIPSFNDVYTRIEDKDIKANIIQKIFWTLNDHIYRHIVLEWCDELGVKLNLYGKYWDTHPRFKKYAKGIISHGEELSIAYQAAKYCLHLNAIEGTHQRRMEIAACSAAPLIRCMDENAGNCVISSILRKYMKLRYAGNMEALSRDEQDFLDSEVFSLSDSLALTDPSLKTDELEYKIAIGFENRIFGNFTWLTEINENCFFADKAELKEKLSSVRSEDRPALAERQGTDMTQLCRNILNLESSCLVELICSILVQKLGAIWISPTVHNVISKGFFGTNFSDLIYITKNIDAESVWGKDGRLLGIRRLNPSLKLHIADVFARRRALLPVRHILKMIDYDLLNSAQKTQYLIISASVSTPESAGEIINLLGKETDFSIMEGFRWRSIIAENLYESGCFYEALKIFTEEYVNNGIENDFVLPFCVLLLLTKQGELCISVIREHNVNIPSLIITVMNMSEHNRIQTDSHFALDYNLLLGILDSPASVHDSAYYSARIILLLRTGKIEEAEADRLEASNLFPLTRTLFDYYFARYLLCAGMQHMAGAKTILEKISINEIEKAAEQINYDKRLYYLLWAIWLGAVGLFSKASVLLQKIFKDDRNFFIEKSEHVTNIIQWISVLAKYSGNLSLSLQCYSYGAKYSQYSLSQKEIIDKLLNSPVMSDEKLVLPDFTYPWTIKHESVTP